MEQFKTQTFMPEKAKHHYKTYKPFGSEAVPLTGVSAVLGASVPSDSDVQAVIASVVDAVFLH